ncbi:MAG: ATP-NAD kinase family protein [Candidatus Thalassarchaeaceae archaeon]|jgi:predicted polyphosphate/ATP-dependent NAD kinase|nr:ATP-NAD kinase family protein [Candidatus Thalassarchaeaceae archaeon]|tara:strand:- start:6163 stop:7296 length:1134 start_codon:yes stop_codon:yes gene_type:complete
MTLVGLLVNPDAGLGGKLGFKGSDGKAEQARSAGAEDRSGPRMHQTLQRLIELGTENVQFLTCGGRMGSSWIPKGVSEISKIDGAEPSSAQDTINAVRKMVEEGIDLLLYSGGDGTTRDIISTLQEIDREDLPLIGVPSGVKMHSGCFAATPRAAAEVLHAWLRGDLLIANTEVMDLDEEAYLRGEWKVRLYAEAMTPSSPRWMQGAKQRIETSDESEIIEGMAEHIGEMMEENSDLLIIWGSGGTLRRMAKHLGFEKTVLGIDVVQDGIIIAGDVNEFDLLKLLSAHNGKSLILLSPMGGQGFLIGRGNLQISPAVIRQVGIDGVLGIATPAKLLTLTTLRIDSGERTLDDEFRTKKYLKVLQGYRTTRLIKVSQE